MVFSNKYIHLTSCTILVQYLPGSLPTRTHFMHVIRNVPGRQADEHESELESELESEDDDTYPQNWMLHKATIIV